jgi:hypothetical protein
MIMNHIEIFFTVGIAVYVVEAKRRTTLTVILANVACTAMQINVMRVLKTCSGPIVQFVLRVSFTQLTTLVFFGVGIRFMDDATV